MSGQMRFTLADLEVLQVAEGTRCEIIDGELYISAQPHYRHQLSCTNACYLLEEWNRATRLGQSVPAPGVIFADDDVVAPDAVWCSYERLDKILREDGMLHAAPELMVEVLSPGKLHEQRDREIKLKLYSRRGVQEYWILDWMTWRVEVYRRKFRQLRLIETLGREDTLQSPLLPGFSCRVADLFEYPPPNGANGKHSASPKRKK